MAEERLIRKYANRRLYDAQDSRHVTLDDLRKLIAGGQRIKVVDDKSGVDTTRSVLLQIIASQEQFGDRKSTRLNSSHSQISYAVFCLKKKNIKRILPARVSHRRLFQRGLSC